MTTFAATRHFTCPSDGTSIDLYHDYSYTLYKGEGRGIPQKRLMGEPHLQELVNSGQWVGDLPMSVTVDEGL